MKLCSERITQNVVKSHLETCQYSPEEMKKLTWNLYTPEETRSFQLKVQHHHTRWHLFWLCLLVCLFVNGCIINLCAFSLQNGCGSSAPCTLQTPSSMLWSSLSASLDSWTSARMTRSSCSKQVSAAFVPHGLQITNPWLYNRFLIRIALSTHCRDMAFWCGPECLFNLIISLITVTAVMITPLDHSRALSVSWALSFILHLEYSKGRYWHAIQVMPNQTRPLN